MASYDHWLSNDGQAFIRGLHGEVQDRAAHGAFADYLEEHGDPLAPVIRRSPAYNEWWNTFDKRNPGGHPLGDGESHSGYIFRSEHSEHTGHIGSNPVLQVYHKVIGSKKQEGGRYHFVSINHWMGDSAKGTRKMTRFVSPVTKDELKAILKFHKPPKGQNTFWPMARPSVMRNTVSKSIKSPGVGEHPGTRDGTLDLARPDDGALYDALMGLDWSKGIKTPQEGARVAPDEAGRAKATLEEMRRQSGGGGKMIASEAREYHAAHKDRFGLDLSLDTPGPKWDPELSQRTAAAFEKAKHLPNHPKVKEAYDALKQEILAQHTFLAKKGVQFTPWTKEGQPYANSAEMSKDARDNRHLFYFPTKGGFGQGEEGAKTQPLNEQVPGHPEGTVYNDLFRAVHDYFGHAMSGNQFGPKGELKAWADHARMFSPKARLALTTETHGQNSWVNFGPQSHLPVTERPYAEQKATILPKNVVPRMGTPEKLARPGDPNDTAGQVRAAFTGVAGGLKEASDRFTQEQLAKHGHVPFRKPEAADIFAKNNPTWRREVTNGEHRFFPPAPGEAPVAPKSVPTVPAPQSVKAPLPSPAATKVAAPGPQRPAPAPSVGPRPRVAQSAARGPVWRMSSDGKSHLLGLPQANGTTLVHRVPSFGHAQPLVRKWFEGATAEHRVAMVKQMRGLRPTQATPVKTPLGQPRVPTPIAQRPLPVQKAPRSVGYTPGMEPPTKLARDESTAWEGSNDLTQKWFGPDYIAHLKAIHKANDTFLTKDHTPSLVFADRLEENGDPLAAVVRRHGAYKKWMMEKSAQLLDGRSSLPVQHSNPNVIARAFSPKHGIEGGSMEVYHRLARDGNDPRKTFHVVQVWHHLGDNATDSDGRTIHRAFTSHTAPVSREELKAILRVHGGNRGPSSDRRIGEEAANDNEVGEHPEPDALLAREEVSAVRTLDHPTFQDHIFSGDHEAAKKFLESQGDPAAEVMEPGAKFTPDANTTPSYGPGTLSSYGGRGNRTAAVRVRNDGTVEVHVRTVTPDGPVAVGFRKKMNPEYIRRLAAFHRRRGEDPTKLAREEPVNPIADFSEHPDYQAMARNDLAISGHHGMMADWMEEHGHPELAAVYRRHQGWNKKMGHPATTNNSPMTGQLIGSHGVGQLPYTSIRYHRLAPPDAAGPVHGVSVFHVQRAGDGTQRGYHSVLAPVTREEFDNIQARYGDPNWGDARKDPVSEYPDPHLLARGDVAPSTLAAALKDLQSGRQGVRRRLAAHVAQEAGMVHTGLLNAASVVPHPRAGLIQQIAHDDPEALNYVAAWYGMLAQEPRLTVFHPGDGNDVLHVTKSPLGVSNILETAGQHGLPGVAVGQDGSLHVLDRGNTNPKGVLNFLQAVRATKPTSHKGAALQMGSGTGEAGESRAAYRDAIKKFQVQ